MERQLDPNKTENAILEKLQKQSPRCVFLEGGNALQTVTEAGKNGGTGIVMVDEIKNGKKAYTDTEGTYGPLLSYYGRKIAGTNFRKAENVLAMENVRIQLLAAGVAKD